MLRHIGLAIVAGFAILIAAGAGGARAQAAAAQTEYVLGPADVIEVSVLGKTDYTTKGRIADDGTFKVPYLGAVMAANRTPGQFSNELARALETGGYFSHPIVQVQVTTYASRYVTVLGEVARPDLVTIDRDYRVSEILARVGGAKDTAAPYVVFRPKNGPERKITMAAMGAGDVNDDPYVLPGDKIFVPEAEMFYVSGQVRNPGAFPLKSEMTFRMALSRAGGLTDSGTDKSLKVTRGGKKLGHVDLDSKVEPGDTIIVPERLF